MDQRPDRTRPERTPAEIEYWSDAEAIFSTAVDLEADARRRVVEQACVGRPDLRRDVEALLGAHDGAGGFMTPVTIERTDASSASVPSAEGQRIGAFCLRERIARGGMGDVYRAERVEGGFAQEVAIKLLGTRCASVDAERRFRAERQILASIHHPNIVRLLDGGVTADGQPYIVMEFVRGVPLTDYCAARNLSLADRLRLFQQLTSAVQWAHRHLIVHRDLKPANVLVGNEGIVKVLDFGVAKLLHSDGPEQLTMQFVAPMTPNYASPEQIRGAAATTACDVYALGVMLFELVTGHRPFDVSGKTLDELRADLLNRSIARPSATRTATAPYDTRLLRGDVDAIVLKAMADLPEDRYAAAEELGDDLARFLDGRPVAAREASVAYLTRRIVGRHRTAFSAAAAALLMLVTASIGALWQARVAAAERERAVRRFNDVRELAGALIFRIHDEVAPLAGSTPVRRTIVAQGLEFLQRLEGDMAYDDRLRIDLARAYVRIGHVQGRTAEANLGDRDGAKHSYLKARDIIAPLMTSNGIDWDVAATAVDAQLALAGLVEREEGRQHADAALAVASRWQSQEPHSTRSQTLLARANYQMAIVTGYPGSLPYWQESARLFDAVAAATPSDITAIRNAALGQKYLGSYFDEADELEKAETHFGAALRLDERRVQNNPGDRQAQLDLAIDIGNVANVQLKRGNYEPSIEAFHRSLEIRQRIAAADPQDVYARGRVAFAQSKLATLYLRTGRLASAQQYAESAVSLYEPLARLGWFYRAQHYWALKALADVHSVSGRRAVACGVYERAKHALGPDDDAAPELAARRVEIQELLAKCARRP
jgi:non-specific serine/threonine protein kinase/serine/threonine-protein kinase